jgi:hypothetical protein
MKKDILYFFKLLFLPCLFFLFSFYYSSASTDSTANAGDIKIGERLYYGLIVTGDNTVNCASCHNTAVIDTFNWNPSVVDLAYSTQDLDSAAFANTLLNPVTKRISDAHENIQLSSEQILLIRKYINTFKKDGLTKPKMLVTRLAFFILLIIVFIAAFIDLTFTKIIRFKPLHGAIMFIALAFIFKIIYEDAVGLGRSENYAPLQPIKFSHKVHATDNKIDCFYCHHTAETAKSAGIPSTNVCLNCHELVREGTNSGRYEIQKILSNAENGHSTEWIRIHKLPDHVFFSHAQHVGVGKLDCSECHGNIKEDHLAKQYEDLSMGWCLECHRTRKVDFLGNDYYEQTFEAYHEQFKNKMLDSLTIAEMGGENCMKCHY